jgi:hypothetical protein
MAIVVVRCDEQQRPVFVDQQHQGMTDQELAVPEESHVFDLGGSGDYEPPFQEIFISNTAPQPILVVFNPLLAFASRPPVPARRARKAAPKRARKKTAKKGAPKKPARAKTTTKKSGNRAAKTHAAKPAKKSSARTKTSAKRKTARGKK